MHRWEGKVAVVTGASAGIGASISEELVKAGVVVVGLARRAERLEKLSASLRGSKGKFYAKQCDVTKEEDLLNAFNWVNKELGGVDILVNNAGVVTSKRIIDDDIDSFRKIFDVNVLAMAIGIREAVASMKSRDVAGHIININSIAGHEIGNWSLSLYTPSKYAVTAMTETVRKELAAEANRKIKITSLSPGEVKTEIFQVPEALGDKDLYEKVPYLDPKDIADGVLYVLGTRDEVQVTELTIRPVGEIC